MQSLLYSIILELCAVSTTAIPAHRGDHTHALFLDLVRQVDADLSSRLHDEPEYRPFTVSVLHGARMNDGMQLLQAGQIYRLRLTLLDGGGLWQRLSAHFLETSMLTLRLDKAELQLTRVVQQMLRVGRDIAIGKHWRLSHLAVQSLCALPVPAHSVWATGVSRCFLNLSSYGIALCEAGIDTRQQSCK